MFKIDKRRVKVKHLYLTLHKKALLQYETACFIPSDKVKEEKKETTGTINLGLEIVGLVFLSCTNFHIER